MTHYLLDTDVVSALRRPDRIPPATMADLDAIDLDDTIISAVTVEELERGVLRKERTDANQGRVLRDWLENTVMTRYTGAVTPIDEAVARVTARLQVPDPRPYAESLIAATAIVHGAILLTGNAKDHPPTSGLTVSTLRLTAG